MLLIKADHVDTTLVDPDLQIKEGGGGGRGGRSTRPLEKEGGPVSNFCQFGPQIKAGEGRGGEGRGGVISARFYDGAKQRLADP